MTERTGRPSGNGLTYADAGVSIEAGEELVRRIGPAAAATHRPGVMGGLGGFAGLFDLAAAGHADSVLVAATDGVGTKLKIAIETGLVDGLGRDLVAMCVNDLVCQGAEPLFFLDYFATGRLAPAFGARVVIGIAEACRAVGCALLGGETAEMPGLYADGDFDLAGFAVGAAPRARLLPRPARAGDRLLGLASSGLHSNGFSLVRKIVAQAGIGWDAPAPFAPERALGEALLEPTRLYTPALVRVLGDPGLEAGLVALAHVTGGGLVENPPRALSASPDAADLALAIDLGAVTPPPVFGWLARTGGVAEAEMRRAFNCGVGMVAIVRPEAEAAIADALSAAGETVTPLGAVIAAPGAGGGVRFSGGLFA